MTPPKVAHKPKQNEAPTVIPRGITLPSELVVKPKQALFNILQEYRDEAIRKNPKSYLASYTVDSLVYAVQEYRASNQIQILTNNGKVPLKEENKYAADGSLKKVQIGELLNLQ